MKTETNKTIINNIKNDRKKKIKKIINNSKENTKENTKFFQKTLYYDKLNYENINSICELF